MAHSHTQFVVTGFPRVTAVPEDASLAYLFILGLSVPCSSTASRGGGEVLQQDAQPDGEKMGWEILRAIGPICISVRPLRVGTGRERPTVMPRVSSVRAVCVYLHM